MSDERSFETRIRDEVEQTPGITFGYIGNFERWGDDRRLYLWVPSLRYDSGGMQDIWSCNAKVLDRAAWCDAMRALRHFRKGYEAAMKEAATTAKPP